MKIIDSDTKKKARKEEKRNDPNDAAARWKKIEKKIILMMVPGILLFCILTGVIFYQVTFSGQPQDAGIRSQENNSEQSNSIQNTGTIVPNVIDRKSLMRLITEAESYRLDLYTKESGDNLKTIISDTRKDVEEKELTDEEILELYLNLKGGLDRLETRES